MKLNWKTFKIVFALMIVVGVIFWAANSVLPRSYSGKNLKFGVGTGTVRVTNPSDGPVMVQVIGAGSRSFTVSSTDEGISGTSTKQRNGTTSTQLVEFELPPGVSEFTVVRGSDVNFVSGTDIRLEATIQPQNAEARTTVIVAAVVILGALFYISRTTGHRWINTLRGQKMADQDIKPLVVPSTLKSPPIRAFGDNRADISE